MKSDCDGKYHTWNQLKRKRCFDEKISISKNFWWGSAASGPQTEGRISGDGKGDIF